jgi:hypothetical protein
MRSNEMPIVQEIVNQLYKEPAEPGMSGFDTRSVRFRLAGGGFVKIKQDLDFVHFSNFIL